jgi:hypothetical protein
MSSLARTTARTAGIALASQRASINHISYQSQRLSSTSQPAAGASNDSSSKSQTDHHVSNAKKAVEAHKKTIAELDEELRLKLEGISGDGGASGVEYENGKASGLKRNVKANMFRVI